MSTVAVRAVLFFVFWLMIAGPDVPGLPIGVAAAAAATWVSLLLLPPTGLRLQFAALGRFVLHFLGQSVRSGAQVAWIAFQPSLPIRPGFIPFRTHLESPGARCAFCALSSLLPGTLPTGSDEQGALVVHCLDTDQPVAASLAEEETMFLRVIGHD